MTALAVHPGELSSMLAARTATVKRSLISNLFVRHNQLVVYHYCHRHLCSHSTLLLNGNIFDNIIACAAWYGPTQLLLGFLITRYFPWITSLAQNLMNNPTVLKQHEKATLNRASIL